MAGIWALFREQGGPSTNPAWIRHGHYSGPAFAWDTPQIPCPDGIWAYTPDDHYGGYLCVDPYDSNLLWVSNFIGPVATLIQRTYLYNIAANTWTIKGDITFLGGASLFCVDMAFDQADGHIYAFLGIGANGALGHAGPAVGGGVYLSVDRGAFTFRSKGFELTHVYTKGNVNQPESLTGLTVKGGAGGSRRVYTSHNSTYAFNGAPTSVISVSADDGSSFLDQTGWSGNKFMLESYGVLRYTPGGVGGDGWYVAAHSPAGSYNPGVTGKVQHDLTANTWGSFGSGTPASGSLAFPFLSNVNRGVSYPTGPVGADSIAHSIDGGMSWTAFTRPSGQRQGFWYRAARTARDTLDTAGVALHRPDGVSMIWWSEDGGLTWHGAEAEGNADGLSLDFGTTIPEQPQVWPQSFYWADSRGFVGRTRFFVAGTSQADAGAHALAILGLLSPMSTARFLAAVGAYNTEPFAPFVGTDAEYNNIEQVLRLEFLTAGRSVVALEMPCPAEAIFLDDQESLALLNPALAAAVAGIPPERLANRGGQEATTFIGGGRISRPQRQRHSIRTLNPNETGPSG